MVREVKGHLTLLGNSKGLNSKREYSVIEIGDQVLQSISISTKLDNFLRRALKWDGQCVLYLVNDIVFAITTPDGKTYCDPKDGYIFESLLGVVGVFAVLYGFELLGRDSPAFGLLVLCVGGLILWASYGTIKKTRTYNGFLESLKLKSGAIEIK